MRYFELRHDPRRRRDEAAEAALREEILAALDAVTSLDHDRILRNQLGLIDATLRTNAFRPGRDAIAFKLRSADVPAIPQPPPQFEIYVYSPAMEGIHLRGGAVARGGIRWSDRQDYRTEVYGLMRAQLTKNAVIVPAGAKGGFYLKQPPAGREALKAEVERQYVRYIGGLLELTDNLVDGEVVHPEGVRVPRRPGHLPGRRGRQGHGDVLGHRQPRRRRSAASGSATRSPPAARPATTTRRSGSPRAARGSRSSATSASSTSTRRPTSSRSSASAT